MEDTRTTEQVLSDFNKKMSTFIAKSKAQQIRRSCERGEITAPRLLDDYWA